MHARQLTCTPCAAAQTASATKRQQLTHVPVLTQGEYVAPEKIEGVYGRSPFIAQVFVYGNSLRAQLVALVVPDAEVLLPWAAQR